MKLNELSPSVPKKNRKRIGRGNSSGWGKTAGKGSNGQKSRAGGGVKPYFEGGQMPIYRRVPKRGFSNTIFKKEYTVISLSFLNDNFEDGEVVSLETLFNKCLIKKGRDGVKVLGNGELNKKLTVKVHKISKSAKAAVEAKGGTVELVEVKGFERAENNK
ncbi:50S ribosomal protein L15 [Fusobacterium vincentii]|uniref:Large ribosomal subunit protein uL15 n=4 Tax=Fusobacterium TaxID=848 RepID=Q7P403_FUSVC|nr:MULTISPECIES: 50S ribosomal protein L15 [Fusobacterium]EAA23335.1 LSU ribosomal protein L15P [Fusobacterium vincentii ATCC 49256]ALF20507.1 50S ribosomal protein L15 [Fusobacterium vincentii ChDC F8]ATV06298.1 50S ribosomal protein L15 [Fusobacterium vincentii]EEO40513.1 50S ribosomal protein L15 [Fusobacterium vincentii 4_1_13]EFG33897.1 50S ribosomal protein L15 [Fusobacterium vincentii 3_1_27]